MKKREELEAVAEKSGFANCLFRLNRTIFQSIAVLDVVDSVSAGKLLSENRLCH